MLRQFSVALQKFRHAAPALGWVVVMLSIETTHRRHLLEQLSSSHPRCGVVFALQTQTSESDGAAVLCFLISP